MLDVPQAQRFLSLELAHRRPGHQKRERERAREREAEDEQPDLGQVHGYSVRRDGAGTLTGTSSETRPTSSDCSYTKLPRKNTRNL